MLFLLPYLAVSSSQLLHRFLLLLAYIFDRFSLLATKPFPSPRLIFERRLFVKMDDTRIWFTLFPLQICYDLIQPMGRNNIYTGL